MPEQMNTFNPVTKLGYWCQKVLPLVYDDSLSYYELLCKVVYKLNELIENNANLPNYIEQLIKEYITSGEMEKVIAEVLSSVILNVKYPPSGIPRAVGDGTEDDTSAIQGCLDYAAKTSMLVFFPNGVYLTNSLVVPTGVSMCGASRYSTRLVLKGGATAPLISTTGSNIQISDLTLDGNADIQVNNLNTLVMTGSSYLVYNLIITDGETLMDITGTGDVVQIDNVLLRRAVVSGANFSGEAKFQVSNLTCQFLSVLAGAASLNINTSNSTYESLYCYATVPTSINIGGQNNLVEAFVENATTSFNDTGTNNTIINYGKSISSKLTGDLALSNANTTLSTTTTALNSTDLVLNPSNPLTYKSPTVINPYVSSVPAKDYNGAPYELLVRGSVDIYPLPVNVKLYGAKGDGKTDDTQAIKAAVASNSNIYFPGGTYLISDTIKLNSGTRIFGDNLGMSQIMPLNNTVLQSKPLISGAISSSTVTSSTENNLYLFIDNLRFAYYGDRTEYAFVFVNVERMQISNCFFGIQTGGTNQYSAIYFGKTVEAPRPTWAQRIINNSFWLTKIVSVSNTDSWYLHNDFNCIHNDVAMQMIDSGGLMIMDNQFIGTILLARCNGFQINNNYFDGGAGHEVPTLFDAISFNDESKWGDVVGNRFFEIPGMPFRVDKTLNGNIYGVNICDNVFQNCDIFAKGTPDVAINGVTDIPACTCANNKHIRLEWVDISSGTPVRKNRTGEETKGVPYFIVSNTSGAAGTKTVLSGNIAIWGSSYNPMTPTPGVAIHGCYPETTFQHPTVYSVTVNPPIGYIQKGSSLQLTAVVRGEAILDGGVTWQLNSASSSISDTGLLTINASETVDPIIIQAKSVQDPTVSGLAFINN